MMLGSSKQKTCIQAFHAQVETRRSFLSSSVLDQMTHQSWITRWMCTRCANEANVFLDAWFETRFHQAVMRLLSMKYHIFCSGIVWGFFDGILQLFVRFHKKANHSVGKEGTRRARLALGGEAACSLLIITIFSKRLLCQNGMREVWHPSCKLSWAPLVCLTIRPVLYGQRYGQCVKGLNVSLLQIFNWRGCSSISLNRFLLPPLVAYLPDEASRIYSGKVPGYFSLLIKFLQA